MVDTVEPEPPPFDLPSIEDLLADPSEAEDHLHAHLTLRALKWLALLEAEENSPIQPGQKRVTLETQVDMFKVIAEWLKTSKKTKGTGEDDTVPGIEQMRAIIAEALATREEPEPEPEEEEEEPEVDPKYASFEVEGRRAPVGGLPKRKPVARPVTRKRPNADPSQLDILINRARHQAYEDPTR